MKTFTRILASGPGAFIITTGLVLVMAKMITVSYASLPDKPEKMSFVINPEINDPPVTPKQKPPVDLKRITPPPAPPMVERQTPSLPTTPIATIDGAIPKAKKLKLEPKTFTLAVSDTDAEPLVRIEPIMPPRAQKSGHCNIRFNVSSNGKPYEIIASYCTQAVFKRPSIKAVEKWNYSPKIQDGLAVARQGVETRITFNLTDEHGRLIPEYSYGEFQNINIGRQLSFLCGVRNCCICLYCP